ncbi:MAG: S24 family peptidase [Phenylobacterium sp.]|uniref:S24 family peptidase n=1 Tax=Phenylobacterium sp. TaxID=1871053 RepID=UPI0027367A33|nr:S24 family peptidase [Phenylobacterium sp.]MDP3749269.1 S24 family peptidase [Phenylobacterium sp.]
MNDPAPSQHGPSELARAARLKAARVERGFPTARAAAETFGWNYNTYASNENANAPFSYRKAREYGQAFGTSAQWLYDGAGAPKPDVPTSSPGKPLEVLVPVIGRVGADPDGSVLFATGQGVGDFVPLPPGGSASAVALRISGHSMRGVADDGGLIYFEDQRTPPTSDMLGHVVVVETDQDEVLVKRLLRGSKPGRFDLESIAGPLRRDCRIRWAAHITAIIPPFQARRILKGRGD